MILRNRERQHLHFLRAAFSPVAAGCRDNLCDGFGVSRSYGFNRRHLTHDPMGRTGYSTKENVNNIETVHLHFGLQPIFDESQKECNSGIWMIDFAAYDETHGRTATAVGSFLISSGSAQPPLSRSYAAPPAPAHTAGRRFG